MSEQTWLRAWKRKPGADYRSYDPLDRVPGPWHLERTDSPAYGSQTWCGRNPGKTTIDIERRERTNPPEAWVRGQGPDNRGKDKVCSACCTALASGQPNPYKGRGRR